MDRSKRGSGGSDRRNSQPQPPQPPPQDRKTSFGSQGRRTSFDLEAIDNGEWFIPQQRRGTLPLYRETARSRRRRSSGGGASYGSYGSGSRGSRDSGGRPPPSYYDDEGYLRNHMRTSFGEYRNPVTPPPPPVQLQLPVFPTNPRDYGNEDGGDIQLIPTDPAGSNYGSEGTRRRQRWFFMWPSGAKPPKSSSRRRKPVAQLVNVMQPGWPRRDGSRMMEQQFIAINDMGRLRKRQMDTMIPLTKPPRRCCSASSSSCCDRISTKQLLKVAEMLRGPPFGPCALPPPCPSSCSLPGSANKNSSPQQQQQCSLHYPYACPAYPCPGFPYPCIPNPKKEVVIKVKGEGCCGGGGSSSSSSCNNNSNKQKHKVKLCRCRNVCMDMMRNMQCRRPLTPSCNVDCLSCGPGFNAPGFVPEQDVAQMGMEAICQLGLNARRNIEMEPLRHLVGALETLAGKKDDRPVCPCPCPAPANPCVIFGPTPAPPPCTLVSNCASGAPSMKQKKKSKSSMGGKMTQTSGPSTASAGVGGNLGFDPDPAMCPYCGLGVFVKRTTLTGYMTALCCFPCGLICCLKKMCCVIKECSYCHAVSDGDPRNLINECQMAGF